MVSLNEWLFTVHLPAQVAAVVVTAAVVVAA
jgi:hypothetical protein